MNRDIVSFEHFEEATKKVHASITKEVLKFYETAKERFKRTTIEVTNLPPVI